MAQTKISSASKRSDAGLTLIEMLVALAIAATVMSFVALSLSGSREARTLDDAVTQLTSDLRAARTQARQRDEAIRVVATAGGYRIDALSIERQWRAGLQASWAEAPQARARLTTFTFTPSRLAQTGLTVTLFEPGGQSRDVTVGAVTGRVDAQ